MDCLANIKFLDAFGQPMNGLAHQLWEGSKLISEYVTTARGESVWIRHPEGTTIDVRVRSEAFAEYKSKVKIKLKGIKSIFIISYPNFMLQELNFLTAYHAKKSFLLAQFKANMVNEIKKLNSLSSKSLNQNFKIQQNRTTTAVVKEQTVDKTDINAVIKLRVKRFTSKYQKQLLNWEAQSLTIQNVGKLIPQACGGEKHYKRALERIAELHPVYQPYVIKLINMGYQGLGICWTIKDSYRSPDAQDALTGGVTNAGPLQSYHQYGLAIDIVSVRNGEIVNYDSRLKRQSRQDQAIADQTLLAPIGESLGLIWGGRWKKPFDPPHFELHPNGKTWRELKPQLLKLGVTNYKKLQF